MSKEKAIQDDDAIQDKDVLDDQDVDSRTGAVDSIVDQIDQDRKIEMGMEPEAELDPDAVVEEDDKEKAEREAREAEELEALKTKEPLKPKKDEKLAEPAKVDLEEEMVKIVVDGEESEVPISKIVDAGKRTFQKESAADSRLEESKRLLSELNELKRELSKPAEPVIKSPEKKEDVTDGMTDQDLLEAIRYGEDDDAVKAIKTLRSRSETIAPDDIGKVIDARIAQKEQSAIVERFNMLPEEGGFSDLAENPIHFQFAKIRVDELVKDGKGNYGSWETYQKAGDWVRETILGQKPAGDDKVIDNPDDPKNQLENLDKSALTQKVDKKRKLTVIDSASKTIETDKTETDDEATLEAGRKQAIKELREQREGGR